MRWEPFEPRSPNAGAGHSADAVKKAVSPGLEWRSWRTTGSQSRESFIRGPTSVSPSGTRGKSRMHKGARTDPCGGCGVTRTPTATGKGAEPAAPAFPGSPSAAVPGERSRYMPKIRGNPSDLEKRRFLKDAFQ